MLLLGMFFWLLLLFPFTKICFCFNYIQCLFFNPRYTPQTIELEYKLKPFIPDFIPAVGDIDAFLKVMLEYGLDVMLQFIYV